MPRLSDNGGHSVYRVNARAARFGKILPGGTQVPRDVTIVAVNVRASSPSVAADWVLSYPCLAGLPGNADVITLITNPYRLRRQPRVWLRRMGTDGYRFALVRRESGPLAETTYDN